MATKSQKKKKLSAPSPSIKAKPPTPKQKPNPPKPAEEQETKKPKKQKMTNEIDDIFEATRPDKKRKQQQEEEAEGRKNPRKSRAEGASKKSKRESRGKFIEPDHEEVEEEPRRRRTNDGLAIYSADELGFGKADAGGTGLCPFDCDCCF